jgi:hypothetical protein
VKIQVGSSMVPDGPVTWKDPVDYTVGTSIEANSMCSGRFLAWRMYTTGNAWWRVRSAQMDIVSQGTY